MSFSDIFRSSETANGPADAIPKYYRALVDILCNLSEAHYYQGNLDTAVSLLESNVEVLAIGKVTLEDRARFQVQRGKMLYYQGAIAGTDSGSALPVLLDAQKLAQSSKDNGCLAKVLDLIGLVSYSQAFSNGNFEKPREYFRQALELRRPLDDRQGICESLLHLGWIYQNKDNRTQEDRQAALTYFRQANALATAGGFELEESYILRHIAAEHQEDGDWEQALTGFEKSLALREQIGYKVYQPTAHLTIGQLHQVRQRLDQALGYYQRAYELAEQMNQAVYMTRAQIAMGDVEKERGDIPGALRHYENALQIANSVNDQSGIAQATAGIEGMTQGS